ncbi:tyrosine-type recombinase/integrase [Bhargavaea ginsengi]|uniref:tyrosine-type recombinase/integrase n=1 Tax=Bhargavaea ginsengi TaxID=426757 RepID=UPI00203F6FEC|nr:tyrosine-type recombinase/integrase [Bhargavaea ginsengi]MCM3087124.1 tyrosine-type recombinase/integrase [Bhargavaea ginsengi]
MPKKLTVTPEILAAVNKVTGQAPQSTKPPSFDDAADKFLDYCKMRGLSPDTLEMYGARFQLFRDHLLLHEINSANIRGITTEHFEGFIRDLMARGYQNSTINLNIRAMRAFFNYCARKKWIKRNPTDDVKRMKERQQVGATFNKSQLKRLLSVPQPDTFEGLRDLTILTMFADTGIRLTELNALNVQDVKLAESSLHIQRTKNGIARRLPLTNRLKALLTVYLEVRGIRPDIDALFVTAQGRRLSRRNIQQRVLKYGELAGLRKEIQVSPHVFRRTFAKNKLMAGVDVFTVQALMGHSNLEILKRYVAIYSHDLDAAIERGID